MHLFRILFHAGGFSSLPPEGGSWSCRTRVRWAALDPFSRCSFLPPGHGTLRVTQVLEAASQIFLLWVWHTSSYVWPAGSGGLLFHTYTSTVLSSCGPQMCRGPGTPWPHLARLCSLLLALSSQRSTLSSFCFAGNAAQSTQPSSRGLLTPYCSFSPSLCHSGLVLCIHFSGASKGDRETNSFYQLYFLIYF